MLLNICLIIFNVNNKATEDSSLYLALPSLLIPQLKTLKKNYQEQYLLRPLLRKDYRLLKIYLNLVRGPGARE